MNSKVQAGEDCSFSINTALVPRNTNDSAPILRKGVVIGGAVVLGGICIANNIAIDANAGVNKDVLEGNITIEVFRHINLVITEK